MKIAIFTDTFLPSINGVVTVVKITAQGLSERGHQVAIFYPNPGQIEEMTWSATGVNLHPTLSLPSFIYPDLRIAAPSPKTFLAVKRFAPDVIHVQAPALIGVEGLVAGKILGIPVVGSFHTYFMEPEYLKIIKLSRFTSITKALWRYTIEFYNRCDAVTVHSQYMADDLVKHGLKRSKIRLMPNALDVSGIKTVKTKNAAAFRKKYGLNDQVILYVGRLSQEKNLDRLISAFAKMAAAAPNAQLVLVGDGPIREDLEILADKLDVAKRVIFPGSIPHDQLLQSGVFQTAAVFCTPSTTETQCMSVLEAMAAGLPIIGMAAMGMIDMIKDNGVLIPPGNTQKLAAALLEFITSDTKRSKASKISLQMARNHSIPEVMVIQEKLYQSLLH